MKILGVDCSSWQIDVDFSKVKTEGFEFAMLRAGGHSKKDGYYKDPCFEKFYKDAVANDFHVGCYYYTGAGFYTEEEAAREANHFLQLIGDKKFDYPIAIDVEEVSPSVGIDNITNATIKMADILEKAGFYVVIYASDISGFKNRLDMNKLAKYDKWVARYNTTGPAYVKDFGIWQYGGSQNYLRSASVYGVKSAACDQNFCYKDYPSIIINKNLNNYSNLITFYNITIPPVTNGDAVSIANLLDELSIDYKIKEV